MNGPHDLGGAMSGDHHSTEVSGPAARAAALESLSGDAGLSSPEAR